MSRVSKITDQVIKELVHHRMAGYYFLPEVETDGNDLGFVVLLREVRFIPRTLAAALMRSVSVTEFETMCKLDPQLRGRLSIRGNDVAMPISLLTSPHIEHLMQTFSGLFGRIGIPDTPPDYLQSLCERQPSFKGAQS